MSVSCGVRINSNECVLWGKDQCVLWGKDQCVLWGKDQR